MGKGWGGAGRVLVRVLPPYRVPRSFLKPQQEDVGWAPALAGKEGGTKETRKRRDPCHEPQTSSLPKDLSRGHHRAGITPTSPATRPESQVWTGPPGAKCLLNYLDFGKTTSHPRTLQDLGLGTHRAGPCSALLRCSRSPRRKELGSM